MFSWRSSDNQAPDDEQEHQESSQENSSQLSSFNFAQANVQVQPTAAPQMKTFLIKKVGDVTERTISFNHHQCKQAFEKACKMYKVPKEKYVLHYALRQSDGKSRRMTISLDEFVEEQCTSFYRTCEEYSQLLLEEVVVSNARAMKPHERLFKAIMTKNFTVDKRFYDTLAEYPAQLCEKFVEKRRYLNLLLGRECGNFLNHGYFLCHLKGCQKLIKLGAFCNISLIITHFRQHSKDGNEHCGVLLRRHDHLIKGSKAHNWKKVYDLPNEIRELNGAKDKFGKSLEVNLDGMFFFVEKGLKFKGAHLLVDTEIVVKLAKGDMTALDSTEIPSTSKRIEQSFYARKASKLKKKAASTTEIQAIPDEIPGGSGDAGEPDPEIDDEDDTSANLISDSDDDEDIGKRNRKRKSNHLISPDDDEEEEDEE